MSSALGEVRLPSSAEAPHFPLPSRDHLERPMPDMPSPKQMFLDTFVPEHATTLKVLRAFPGDKGDFKPHERSQSALMLANTFVIEQMLISMALTDTLSLGSGFPKP